MANAVGHTPPTPPHHYVDKRSGSGQAPPPAPKPAPVQHESGGGGGHAAPSRSVGRFVNTKG